MNLPERFKENMTAVLKSYADGDRFFTELEKPHFRGIRLNTLKCDREKLLLRRITRGESPFCREGFYIDEETKIGNDPYHHAGAFYVQEPSATTAVELLCVQKGDTVLDLCAAPGGKSTQIAAKLNGSGILWSNDAVFKRAQIIVSNFERLGVTNGIVSSAMPNVLANELGGVFDKILVDAPCSGEGMFRKEPQALEQWSMENINTCAERQRDILSSAAVMLREGGVLVYSTCTYAVEENEKNVEWFLREHPEFEPYDISVDFGRPAVGLKNAIRVLPMDGGEGHFVARFKKCGSADKAAMPTAAQKPSKAHLAALDSFLRQNGVTLPEGEILSVGDTLYLSPTAQLPRGLGIIRQGLQLGTLRKDRLLPAHAMFAAPQVKCKNELNIEADSAEAAAFLHGEEIAAGDLRGYCRVLLDGIPLSFGKASGGRLKNGYPKGLRKIF